jgi:hypothetical protein
MLNISISVCVLKESFGKYRVLAVGEKISKRGKGGLGPAQPA